ncbi:MULTISPECIES: TetR/AcrR family transcriptional regulator [Streptomyces]|uniref:TetR/AcrR family transcriptional regulator n=1 Tax=Streptomyces hyaluromycini TaxID=1377993 RepID=A0ABV1WQ43_9ACTN|nr:TetR/AcrR family transcriptional regulator [Streptomyces sp. N50]WOX15407.1 TetR/AcrR family transcriptional regulator [Streptomyces sp. N50]
MGGKPTTTRRPGRPGADSAEMPSAPDVLQRGLEAFAELGYDRASAREFARRLGVGPTFINDRYGSKAAYWRAVVDAALGAQITRMVPAAPGSDDEDVVRQFVREFYRTTIGEPYLAMLMADESARDTERLDYLYQSYIEPTLALVTPSIERLMASGRMARVSIDIVFFAIVTPVSGLVQEPLARRVGGYEHMTQADRLAKAEALAALVMDGLLTPGDAKRR